MLSALLILSPGWATWTAAEDAPAAASGALSIATDPPGASTYVDGQFVGATPISVDRLAVGDHRVRVVKGGYLENGRIVQVTAGKSNSLHVKLTPHAGDASEASQIVTGGGGGGGGSKKWLWIGLAGGGAAIAAVTLVGRNKAPIAGSVVASPTTALAAATTVSFTAQGASDPDGDTLTFSWDFGDGTTGTGASPSKVYSSAGTFTVTVTVSDGKKSATATGTVTVRSLTGTWRGSLSGSTTFNTTLSLTQSGTNVSGSYSDQFGSLTAGPVSGTVSTNSPRVRLTVDPACCIEFIFTGDPSSDVNTLTGTANGSGFVNNSWSMTRQ